MSKAPAMLSATKAIAPIAGASKAILSPALAAGLGTKLGTATSPLAMMLGKAGSASGGEKALLGAAQTAADTAKPWSWLEKQLGKRVTPGQQNMRDLGLSMMQQAMSQGQQSQAPQMQLSPFQPQVGGGGGGGQPQLQTLMEQLGMNRIQ